MVAVLKLYDAQSSGPRTPVLSLVVPERSLSARDIIRRRVEAEVAAYNDARPEHFVGLVGPEGAVRTPAGYRLHRGRALDAEAQVERALEGFQRNHFFLLVNDRQVESLSERFEVEDDLEVSFFRLMPLVGG